MNEMVFQQDLKLLSSASPAVCGEVVKMETSFSSFHSVYKICIDHQIWTNIFFDCIFSETKDVALMLRAFDKCIVK